MATFATKDTNTTDIDPESLTVNLLGPEPDPDNLVIEPQNISVPQKGPADISQSDIAPSETSPAEDESIDKILNAQKPISANITSDDEQEIREIENLLKSSKSSRVKKQKESVQKEIEKKEITKTDTVKKQTATKNKTDISPEKRKIDPVIVVSGIVAAILIFVFAAYFLGMFDSSNTLKMTAKDFSGKYIKTEAYKKISQYGFAFPSVTFTEDTAATTTPAAAQSVTATPAPLTSLREFSGEIPNSLNYKFYLSGNANRSDSKIKDMRVSLVLGNASAFKDVIIVYAPFIQTLYPDMNTKDTIDFLTKLSGSSDTMMIKGNYGLSLKTGTYSDYFYGILDIKTAKDAKAAIDEAKASSSAAASQSAAATATPAA